MPDGPDEQDATASTPDEPTAAPAASTGKELPVFHAIDDLPPPDPQVQLINDDDLSWLDKPVLSDEERERRRERRELRRKQVHSKRRNRRILIIGGSLLGTFLLLSGAWFYWTLGGLERMPDSAGQVDGNTPGTNFLLIGDNPSEPDAGQIPGSGWKHGFAASDLVAVLHLNRANDQMYVISIPGQSELTIPGTDIAAATTGKLADAFEAGGQDLYVKTVETFLGAPVDRVVVLDMNGLREITDEIGGVFLTVPNSDCGVPAGDHRLNGEDVLRYTALNECLRGGDIDRVARQQSVLRALMRGAVDSGEITNPFTLSKLLRSTAGHLTLEDDFSYPSMFSTLFSMRGLRSTSTTFLTVPVAAKPFADGKDTVLLDAAKDAELWQAVRQDRVAEYLALNADVVTQ